MDTFSIGEMIGFGWRTFWSRAWFFIGIELVIAALSISAMRVMPAGILMTMVISMGSVVFLLKAHDDAMAARIEDYWVIHPFWKFVTARVLTGLIVLVGFILLIIPGIIAGLALSFVSYIVMEKKVGPWEAIRQSRIMTYGNRLKLFGLWLVILGINILGLCAFGIGLLVTIPVSGLAYTHAYRTLKHKAA